MKTLTFDRVILTKAVGNRIEFEEEPIQNSPAEPYSFAHNKWGKIYDEMNQMLAKGIIEKTTKCNDQFVSKIFTQDKNDGGDLYGKSVTCTKSINKGLSQLYSDKYAPGN